MYLYNGVGLLDLAPCTWNIACFLSVVRRFATKSRRYVRTINGIIYRDRCADSFDHLRGLGRGSGLGDFVN